MSSIYLTFTYNLFKITYLKITFFVLYLTLRSDNRAKMFNCSLNFKTCHHITTAIINIWCSKTELLDKLTDIMLENLVLAGEFTLLINQHDNMSNDIKINYIFNRVRVLEQREYIQGMFNKGRQAVKNYIYKNIDRPKITRMMIKEKYHLNDELIDKYLSSKADEMNDTWFQDEVEDILVNNHKLLGEIMIANDPKLRNSEYKIKELRVDNINDMLAAKIDKIRVRRVEVAKLE